MAATTFLSLSILAMTAVNASPIKVARADAPKRGIAFNNEAYLKELLVGGSQFSWCYNWGPSFQNPPSGLEFVPLLHGNQPEFTQNWLGNLENSVVNGGAKEVFSFNEPDQCNKPGEENGGSCITNVVEAAQAYRDLVQNPIKSNPKLKHVRMGAPSVTNGPAPKGWDYLNRFLHQCSDCHFDFLNAHWYASATPNQYYDPLKKFQDDMNAIHSLKPEIPLYITEFGFDAGTEGEKSYQLGRILEWMDAKEQDWIQKYAYHMAAPEILLNSAGTELSALGKVYASA